MFFLLKQATKAYATVLLIHFFILNINAVYQPKDPGYCSNDSNSEWKPKCRYSTDRIKCKSKISKLAFLRICAVDFSFLPKWFFSAARHLKTHEIACNDKTEL